MERPSIVEERERVRNQNCLQSLGGCSGGVKTVGHYRACPIGRHRRKRSRVARHRIEAREEHSRLDSSGFSDYVVNGGYCRAAYLDICIRRIAVGALRRV
jgi:hypothetical protein